SFKTSRPSWDIQEKPKSHNEHYNGAQGIMWSADPSGTTFETIGGWNTLRIGPSPGYFIGAPTYDGVNYDFPEPKIFTYNAVKDEWSNRPLSKDKDVTRIAGAAHAVSVSEQKGFAIGGSYIDEEGTTKDRLPS